MSCKRNTISINLKLDIFSIILFCIIRSKVLKLLIIVLAVAALGTLGVVDGSDNRIANGLHFLHGTFDGVLIGVVVRVEPVFSLCDGVLD